MFDFSKVDDFDKHIELSIPNYKGLIDIVSSISLEYLPNDGRMIDIGCSSGKLLNHMSEKTDAELMGCDPIDMGHDKNYKFSQDRAMEFLANEASADVVTSIFTLQFMGIKERKGTISEIKKMIADDAVFIIAEKTHLDDSRLNAAVFRQHMRKKLDGFTAEQVLNKDLDLAGSMFPLNTSEINRELESMGIVEQIWQSYNFKAWVIKKRNG